MLTIALNRGRILRECLPLLEEIGIVPAEPVNESRKLVFASTCGNFSLVIMRGSDVPTYVEYGAADVGITGKDVLHAIQRPASLGVFPITPTGPGSLTMPRYSTCRNATPTR